MPYVPTSGGGAPAPLDTGHRLAQPSQAQAGLAGKTQAFRLAYQGYAHRMDFSSTDRPPV